MDDIAFAGGITKPVLYQHFDSKRALYIAVLEDGGSRLIDSISIATRKSSTLREQVTLGFDAYFNFVRDDEAAFRLLFTSSSKSDTDFVVVKNKVLEQFCDHVTSLVIDQKFHSHIGRCKRFRINFIFCSILIVLPSYGILQNIFWSKTLNRAQKFRFFISYSP